MKRKRMFLLAAACLGFTTALTAQTLSRAERRARVDSMLSLRYYKTPYDTNYVVRPEGRLTLKVRMNQTGNSFHAKGTVNDVYAKADLSTSHKTTFSLAAIYRGIGVGLALNPWKWGGFYKDYELNVNFYSSRLSLDLSYQRSESLTGDLLFDEVPKRLEQDEATLKVLNVAAYYAFNHRRFSFPAAFTQSYIQRRSAGSWLAGVSYQGGSIKTTDHLLARNPDAPVTRIYFGHVGIGGGYGYNWVLGRGWLLHFSMLPTFVVYNRNNMTLRGQRKEAQHMRFNMIFNERAAVVYQFPSRYFAGATLVMNNSVFDDVRVVVNQNKWRVRAFLGMRLGK